MAPLEFSLPLVSAALALVPLVSLARAYSRTRSTRVLLAALAFAGFVVSGISLALVEYGATPYPDAGEWIELAGDVVIVALFTASFLWPRGEPHES